MHLLQPEYSVGVGPKQPSLHVLVLAEVYGEGASDFFVLALGAATQDEELFLVEKHQLPQVPVVDSLLDKGVGKGVGSGGAASQVLETVQGEAASESEVGAVQLGVGFLEDEQPEGVRGGSGGEDGAALGEAREIVIYGYGLPLPVFAKAHAVDAFFVIQLVHKQLFNEGGMLSERSYSP